jgi:hypothetical protein
VSPRSIFGFSGDEVWSRDGVESPAPASMY